MVTGYSQSKPEEINVTPNGVLDKVFDQTGKEYALSDLLVNRSGVTLINCSSTSYFNLYFEVGSGMENASDPAHIARRAVVCKVFEDLSNFINSPLSTNGNRVNIWVRNINNVFTAPNGILGLATGFYNVPSITSIGGIADNEIWKTIHTGSDSYLNSTVPLTVLGGSNNQSGLFFHGMVTFNFNTTNTTAINFNTNLTATTVPAGEFDLYSAVLHEVTHALGFASLIDQNGISIFGPNFRYYSRYDRFLKTNNSSQFLLTSSGCSPMYNYTFNTTLNTSVLHPNQTPPCANTTACGDAIQFVGLTNTVPVYTPKCFNPISSLSHFEDTHFPTCNTTNPNFGNDNYFVMCNAGNSGMMRRFLRPEERNTLCDIGYSVNTTFGSTAVVNSFVNYGGTTCNGISVAGINDGINNDGFYTFIGDVDTNISINGSTILLNDTSATGFECLEDLTATTANPTTLSNTFGTAATPLTFKSDLAGLHLLRYVPTNGVQRGNITYIYVFVQPIVTNPECNPLPTGCNLVNNGDFEQNNSYMTTFDNTEFSRLCGWYRVGSQSPEYMFANTIDNDYNVPCNKYGFQNDSIVGNDGYGAIKITDYSPLIWKYSDILGTTLNTVLQPNTTYQLSFDVSIAEFWRNRYVRLQAFLSSSPPVNVTGFLIPDSMLSSGILLNSTTFSSSINDWETITFTFTTTDEISLKYLYIGGLNNFQTQIGLNPIDAEGCTINATTNVNTSVYYIDNVSLIATGGASLNLPESICGNQSLSDLSQFISGVRPDGTFLGTGVTTTAGISSFSATTAGLGTHVINYTYNNNLGCPVTLSDTILVTNTSNGITMDAVNDNFIMPIDAASGGVTTSVYANDFYNGIASSSASLPNVSFSLVTPIPVTGATINSMGLISIPAGTPANTYVFTYRLNVIGNCSNSDTATVTVIVASNINTPNLVAGIRANERVDLIELQNTQRSIISGSFTTYNNISRPYLARLLTNLTLDTTFSFAGDQPAMDLAVDNVNNIYAATWKIGFGGSSWGITKLTPNGGVDSSFNSGGVGTERREGYTNNNGRAVAIQPNGRILLGGDFYYYNGEPRLGIVRLNPNGSIDPDFKPTELLSYYRSVVTKIVVQPNGRILLLGFFSPPVSGVPQKHIIRLMPDGKIDAEFTMGDVAGSVPYNDISVSTFGPFADVKVLDDGRIIVAGAFTKYNGANVKSIIRLTSTGGFDSSFNVITGVNRAINDMTIEPVSNKIIIGGEFTAFGSAPIRKLVRLHTNGSLDTDFSIGSGTTDSNSGTSNPFVDNYIKVLKLQPDGKIIVGGNFLTFNGLSATNITRIFGNAGLQQRSSIVEYQSEPEINTNFESNVIVYPNPSSSIFNFDLTQVEQKYKEIIVYNILGEKVFSSEITPRELNSINLSHLANGYYLAKLSNDSETVTLKLIKN